MLAPLLFAVMCTFNALAAAATEGLFLSTVGDLSDQYQLYITPAGWAFTIWTVIYLWLALSLAAFVITIFIRHGGTKLYLDPPVLTPAFSATLCINFALNTAWIFVWDRSEIFFFNFF